MHRLGCGAGWHSITGGTRGCGFIAVSWNRWAGRNLKAHPFLTTVMGRDASHHFRVPRAHPAQPRAPPRRRHPPYLGARASPYFPKKTRQHHTPLTTKKTKTKNKPKKKPQTKPNKRDPQSSGRAANFPSPPPATLRWANAPAEGGGRSERSPAPSFPPGVGGWAARRRRRRGRG